MKILVMFGSKSDAGVYEPLKRRLESDGHQVDFRMISVHRSPELLDRELTGLDAQAVVAGAGLAAHLPGVLASKLLLPVFGIPCAAALGGVDALFSILQMPFGIPVLTAAPDRQETVADFLRSWEKLDLRFRFDGFRLVYDHARKETPHFAPLLARAQRIAEKANLEISHEAAPVAEAVNLCLVEIDPADPERALPWPAPGTGEIRIHVPMLNEQNYRDPYAAVAVVKRIASVYGGAWVGVNNVGNAMLAALQLANASGGFSAFLTSAKKGYVHP
ncbi:MAG: AIR carboxylase family protein [Bdellovibrionales bacterium]|nr:AIR carboxylase family protein [Bdellovibrionales bacterium]